MTQVADAGRRKYGHLWDTGQYGVFDKLSTRRPVPGRPHAPARAAAGVPAGRAELRPAGPLHRTDGPRRDRPD